MRITLFVTLLLFFLSEYSSHLPSMQNNKQATALLSLANIISANEAAKVILNGGLTIRFIYPGKYRL